MRLPFLNLQMRWKAWGCEDVVLFLSHSAQFTLVTIAKCVEWKLSWDQTAGARCTRGGKVIMGKRCRLHPKSFFKTANLFVCFPHDATSSLAQTRQLERVCVGCYYCTTDRTPWAM